MEYGLTETLVDALQAERLLHLTALRGREWLGPRPAPPMPVPVWESLLSAARASNRRLHERKKMEAGSYYARRHLALEQERRIRREQLEERKRTAEERGAKTNVLRLFDDQLRHSNARFDQRLKSLDEGREVLSNT